ncbi:MAG TPA: leucine-rich repeat protein [Candidatus Coproplasma avicola]|uniref:Leucine-rich repeat protein n=1 Tax=Candidatus Coproplasma avicola TaxID=2840744 RepID=A0A9D1E5L2_9FIRM|nr:leucine-rich repeat protein [Candidatus Coproplasma avicola]
MKKKILTVITVLATAASCAFSVTACGGNGNQTGRPEWTIETAYAEAQDLGYEGTLEQFLEQIKGKDGADGKDGTGIQSVGIDSNGNLLITLTTGTQLNLGNVVGKDGQDGLNGSDGLSAYQIWLNNGHEGTEEDFLEWLKGDDGKDGVDGSNGDDGKDGSDGLSAYQIWLNNGHEGSEEDFLEWLKGDDGKGIDRIEKTSSDGLVDTYTIYFTDGTFTTFEITNGGTDQSQENTQGLDFYPLDDGTYGVACGNAKYLSEIVIPATYNGKAVTTIVDVAFSSCANLKSIAIPDSVTTIGNSTFASCTSLTSINIPNSVISIDNAAFGNCTSLTSIDIPNSVISIGDYAFENCTSLEQVKLNEGLKTIGYGTFTGCNSLKELSIPSSVTTIAYRTIVSCSSLSKIIFNEGTQSIEGGALTYCPALKEIVIPKSITYIDSSAFEMCDNLSTIYYCGETEQWTKLNFKSNANVYYYSESKPTEEGNYWHYVDGVPTVW